MLALFLVIPLAVWMMALLIWLYWYDLRSLFFNERVPDRVTNPAPQSEKDDFRERIPEPQPREKISEEDRKKLDDVLKQRN